MCYVKQVGNKQWVAKGVVSIQWRGEVGHYKMNIVREKEDRSIVFVDSIIDCVE
jgi:hypothetical protein